MKKIYSDIKPICQDCFYIESCLLARDDIIVCLWYKKKLDKKFSLEQQIEFCKYCERKETDKLNF